MAVRADSTAIRKQFAAIIELDDAVALPSVTEQLAECLHERHAAMPHGRLRCDIHARFGAPARIRQGR
jgi:hypothetical protein